MKFAPAGKFSSKLGFDQRCEVLALHRTGVGRSVLAEAYGLDRRTVTHIYNPNSPHYRAVREEEERLGKEEFLKKYITENAVSKLRKVMKTEGQVIPTQPHGPPGKRTATKYAGVHEVKNENTVFPHRIQVAWREGDLDNAGPGWYYRDADGAHPEAWLHNGGESRMSSLACLEAVQENLVDI
jgi:hypothetical protein